MDTGLFSRVREFVADQRGVDVEKVSEATTLFGDLGLDGDDATEFFQAFARAFQVDISEFDFSRFFGREGLTLAAPLIWLRQAMRNGTPEERAGFAQITVGQLVRAAEQHQWPL